MYHWTDISNNVTECHEFFIRVGTRGVVLRPKVQQNYNAFVEREGEQHEAEQPFPSLHEAKGWCEEQLHQVSAPPAGFYVFARLPERDTEKEYCFVRVSKAFNRSGDALNWYHATGQPAANSRIYLMLDNVPERFYEPRDSAGEIRLEF